MFNPFERKPVSSKEVPEEVEASEEVPEPNFNQDDSSNVVNMSQHIVTDPITGIPLRSIDSVDEAKRAIRQASEDAREAA